MAPRRQPQNWERRGRLTTNAYDTMTNDNDTTDDTEDDSCGCLLCSEADENAKDTADDPDDERVEQKRRLTNIHRPQKSTGASVSMQWTNTPDDRDGGGDSKLSDGTGDDGFVITADDKRDAYAVFDDMTRIDEPERVEYETVTGGERVVVDTNDDAPSGDESDRDGVQDVDVDGDAAGVGFDGYDTDRTDAVTPACPECGEFFELVADGDDAGLLCGCKNPAGRFVIPVFDPDGDADDGTADADDGIDDEADDVKSALREFSKALERMEDDEDQ